MGVSDPPPTILLENKKQGPIRPSHQAGHSLTNRNQVFILGVNFPERMLVKASSPFLVIEKKEKIDRIDNKTRNPSNPSSASAASPARASSRASTSIRRPK